MLACRSWLEAAKDPTLFSSFDLEPAFEAAGAGRSDSPFWWTPAFQRRVDAMLRSVSEFGAGGVREIRVRHCSDVSLAYATESFFPLALPVRLLYPVYPFVCCSIRLPVGLYPPLF
ncbi:Putative F-box/LRR-repeat protein 19 [Dendrobium catenatum]|uniref:F-box/LRR-repeat protein 19 n=1 Tax=Dendrobium catenatum TaxID=906689 RepID=A0A2I0VSZ8_9ASPA|nr:Putative F-box/LRR-repeat protein 19 [Dendrobium catenatum]